MIDVEYEDAPLEAEKIEPMFSDAADILDHSAAAVTSTMKAAREAGVDVGDSEAGKQVQEVVARAGRTASELRAAGVSAAKAKDAGKRFYKGLEKLGDAMIKIRGNRVLFARKF